MVTRPRAFHALVLALGLTLAACDDKGNTYVPPPPPEVTVAKPARKDITDYLYFTGNTDAIQTVTLVARVQGFLEKQHFQDGQSVKKGDLLFTIQRDTYKAQLDAANAQVAVVQAQLDHAQTEYTRYLGLAKRGAAPQTDVDQWQSQLEQAKANLLAAQAQVELAQLNYGYTLVTAPFDGRMGRRFVDPGNLVGAGEATKLAEINQIDPMYVYFTINERDLLRVTQQRQKAGDASLDDLNKESIPLEMGLSTQEDFPYKGQYDFAALSVTPTTGTLLLRGIFPNSGGWIQPGLFARVRAPLGTAKDAILVPQVAIGFDQLGRYVLVVDEKNVVQRMAVEVGATEGEDQVVTSGLKGDERVIVNGILRAVPGHEVRPVEAKAPPSA
ncbi:MAG: efflux RND transporter periplasmic adaptor subunit [Geminicoccaceae bacterium]